MSRRRFIWAAVLVFAPLEIQAAGPATPDQIAYSNYQFLFRHVTFLKNKAQQKIASGQTQTQLAQTYKVAAGLTDAEASALETISVGCVSTVNQILAQAAPVIAAAKAAPHAPQPAGTASPPRNPLLAAIQQQRIQAVLGCRDALHQKFGDQRFAQFDAFLRAWVSTAHAGVQPVQSGPPNGIGQ